MRVCVELACFLGRSAVARLCSLANYRGAQGNQDEARVCGVWQCSIAAGAHCLLPENFRQWSTRPWSKEARPKWPRRVELQAVCPLARRHQRRDIDKLLLIR